MIVVEPWSDILRANFQVEASTRTDNFGGTTLVMEGRQLSPRQIRGTRWKVICASEEERTALRSSPLAGCFVGL
jgi:hypothetical protein